MISSHSNFPKSLSGLFSWSTAIIAILFGLLCTLTPLGADDLLFLDGVEPSGNFSEMWEKLISACQLRWTTETGRLGVFLSLGFLYLLPKWVFGIVLAFSLSMLVRYSCKLADIEPGSVLGWMVLAAIVFFAPWYDFMFHVSFAMNYVVGGAITVSAAYFFINIERIFGWKLLGVFILMFAAGWIHEAYSAPFGIAATIWIIRRHKSITLKTILAWLILGAGAGVIALSPTLWQRAESEMLILKFPIKEAVMQLGPSISLTVVFLIISRVAFHWKRLRSSMQKDTWLFLAIYIIVSVVVLITFYCGPRTGFPTILFSIIGIAYVFSLLTVSTNRPVATVFVGLFIGLGCMGHLGYACYKEYRLRNEYNDIVRLYKASKDGTFYYDLTYPKLDASLYKTSVRDFHSRIPMGMWEGYYDGKKHLVILPTAMKGFSRDAAMNSSRTKNALIYNSWIVFPASYDLSGIVKLTIYTKDGRKMLSRYRVDEFKDENGESYKLIVPHVKVLDQSLEISDVEIK